MVPQQQHRRCHLLSQCMCTTRSVTQCVDQLQALVVVDQGVQVGQGKVAPCHSRMQVEGRSGGDDRLPLRYPSTITTHININSSSSTNSNINSSTMFNMGNKEACNYHDLQMWTCQRHKDHTEAAMPTETTPSLHNLQHLHLHLYPERGTHRRPSLLLLLLLLAMAHRDPTVLNHPRQGRHQNHSQRCTQQQQLHIASLHHPWEAAVQEAGQGLERPLEAPRQSRHTF